jgi:hypothetical protein
MEAVVDENQHLSKALRKTMKILSHHTVSSTADLQIRGDQQSMPLYLWSVS